MIINLRFSAKVNQQSTLSMLEHNKSEDSQNQINTPKSTKNKKAIHLKKLLSMNIELLETEYKTFVVGICGGDCAGKRQMIQYMFENITESQWRVRETGQPVTILSQAYFINTPEEGLRFSSAGTNWQQFYKKTLSLIVGNEVQINYKKDEQMRKITVKPAKLLIIEGSHIFMSNQVTHNLSSLFNLKVFIDSDSDVRLSRRVYQDTQQRNRDLNWSITNYLQFIKPSYQKQIQPLKQISDIIIPHFGGGFNDHKKTNRLQYDSNIKNACSLILTHLKQQMRKYEEQIEEEA